MDVCAEPAGKELGPHSENAMDCSGEHKHVLGILCTMAKDVVTSEFAMYLAVHMAAVLLALGYLRAGLCYLSPPDTKVVVTATDLLSAWGFGSVDAKACTSMVEFLMHTVPLAVGPAVLFLLGVAGEALKHLGVPDPEKGTAYWIALCWMLAVCGAYVGHFGILGVLATGLRPIAMYIGAAEAVSFALSRTPIVLFGVLAAMTGACLVLECCAPHILCGAPISEHLERSGKGVLEYNELLSALGADISRVFVVKGLVKSVSSNGIPFRRMMAVFVDEDFLKGGFEAHRDALVHSVGHARHFDALYFQTVPVVLGSIAVYALGRVPGRGKMSALGLLVAKYSKVQLFFLVAFLVRCGIGQVCELRADRFAESVMAKQ